jgi:hypothetical protein
LYSLLPRISFAERWGKTRSGRFPLHSLAGKNIVWNPNDDRLMYHSFSFGGERLSLTSIEEQKRHDRENCFEIITSFL